MDSSSDTLHSFSATHPSSIFLQVITFTDFLWDDVACVIYETADCVASASEYGRDVYSSPLENILSNTTSCEETILCVRGK